MSPIDWKVVTKIGIPTFFACVLLYFALGIVHAELHSIADSSTDTDRIVKLHLEDSSNKLNVIQRNERALLAVATIQCVNNAKSAYERSSCIEASRNKE